ncbi:hypothetical protein EDD22DRAFT_45337 [Suillus occidentalis]|nr:hypothetical protein EDD22DRAFT_45337 [Suillus occidentalis]
MALDCESKMNIPISHTFSMRTLCTPGPTVRIPSFSFSSSGRRANQCIILQHLNVSFRGTETTLSWKSGGTYRTSASAWRNLRRWMSLIWSQVGPYELLWLFRESCKQRRASREDHKKRVVCLYSLTTGSHVRELAATDGNNVHRQVSLSRCTNRLRNSQFFNGVELYRNGISVGCWRSAYRFAVALCRNL